MASFETKIISELSNKSAVSDTDIIQIADSSGNMFKATWAKIKEWLLGTKDISGVGDGSVTGAISQLNTKIVNALIVRTCSGTISINKSSVNTLSVIPPNVDGYLPVGIMQINPTTWGVIPERWVITSGKVEIRLRNVSTSNLSGIKTYISVLYFKTAMQSKFIERMDGENDNN